MIPFIGHYGKGKTTGTRNRPGAGDVGRGSTTKGQEETLWGDRSVFYLDYGGGYMTLCICQNSMKYTPYKQESYHI